MPILEPERFRHPHDFLDDLESFFWLYAWIIANYDRPGLKRRPKALSRFAKRWKRPQDAGETAYDKYVYIVKKFEPWMLSTSPYFSLPPYEALLEDVRAILVTFTDRRNASEDLFLFIREIYSQVLAAFDAAIVQLGGTPPPAVSISAVPMCTDSAPPAAPLDCAASFGPTPQRDLPHLTNKRPFHDDPTSSPVAKRSKKVDALILREGVRRSQRIIERDAKAAAMASRIRKA